MLYIYWIIKSAVVLVINFYSANLQNILRKDKNLYIDFESRLI